MTEQPLVIAYHLIWTAYGWWLPNDPRGSGSTTIRNDLIAELGELHFGRKRVQPAGRIVREFYEQAAKVLQHPLLTFDATSRAVIGAGFADAIQHNRYTCYACAIMPDHVHILIRKHRDSAEDMIEKLKTASRLRLSATGLRTADHPTWAGGSGWRVFLDHPDDVRRTITYIDKNPAQIGLALQRWAFVKDYDGWPLHPGHSPHSPYVQRLRQAGRY